ncbi:MAG: Asp-tRNA(Asn)/Glu-tRNA(Gln) amidotransferase subunit GatA [Bdellovibrionales bacterium]|nr:Asp-tRNA(Asn)/Glu-tRNA(Gln) amidotransferase subunit GatA [Bdellovibrionales bacterium]
MAELWQSDLWELSEGLEKREFSSKELTQMFLERIAHQEHLGCYLSVFEEKAIEQAEKADARRAAGDEVTKLTGVPLAIKDIITLNYGTTTCGSRFLEDYRSPFTATAAQRLLKAGTVILGKTNLDEFGMGSSNENSAFGPVKNPWDTSRVAGGSSGGSAAAVAARLCPAALGTDTGGSIRQPSAFCNVTGLKPSYGRVSRYGLVAFASSLDQIGPMGKNARDCALISECIFGRDIRDSTSAPNEVPLFSSLLERDIKGLRIGVPKEYFREELSSEIASAIHKGLGELEKLGAEIKEVSLPHTDFATAAYYVIVPAEASSNLSRFDGIRYGKRADAQDLISLYAKSRSEGFGPEVKRRILIGTFVLSAGYYDAYYVKAQRARALIARDFEEAFSEKVDVIAAPTTPTTPFLLGEKTHDPISMYLNDIFTVPVNLAGLPSLSLPCGQNSSGLPIGFQLIGRAFDELTLFQVADAFQKTTDWHLRTPETKTHSKD